ncbi:MAG: O-succinylbenzoate synthase [Micrococcales bacterium]|nr:O-succinylbenzoate synthase [Actinomycetota bacterium]NCA08141.1 O-succinylbenzoate synthase [Micrococcales bacterium]
MEITPEIKEQILGTAKVLAIPMRTKFRGLTTREVLLFEGPNGWAEWSPFTEYEDEEASIWLNAAIEWAFGDIPKTDVKTIKVNATLPAVKDVRAALAPFGKFEVVKIKVAEAGQTLQDDLDRIHQVREHYPDARIRLDANGNWDIETALKIAKTIYQEDVPLEYLEQPVRTIAEMAELKLKLQEFNIKIAADESVRKVSDPLAVAQANAADILVLKAAPLGGINNALHIAKEAGLPVVVSSALETSVGISMGAHLAALLNSEYVSGLATAALLTQDVTDTPLIPVDGEIPVSRVKVSQSFLNQGALFTPMSQSWVARLTKCLDLA